MTLLKYFPWSNILKHFYLEIIPQLTKFAKWVTFIKPLLGAAFLSYLDKMVGLEGNDWEHMASSDHLLPFFVLESHLAGRCKREHPNCEQHLLSFIFLLYWAFALAERHFPSVYSPVVSRRFIDIKSVPHKRSEKCVRQWCVQGGFGLHGLSQQTSSS